MSTWNLAKWAVVPLAIGAGLLLRAGAWYGGPVSAQSNTASPQPVLSAQQGRYADPYDRGAMMYGYQRVGKSGVARGQEIYYMRCWMCHSEYVMATDPSPAPSLRDVFKRNNAQYVEGIIRSGGARMPAYTPETLTDEELKDLVAYLEQKCGTYPTGGGCFDEHNPPPNPLYRFSRDVAPTHLGPKRSDSPQP